MALREFVRVLEQHGELHRTTVPVDPALELTEISTRALKEGKPALLVESPSGSSIPVVVNHFSSSRRIELALNRHPGEIGNELIQFFERMIPPTLSTLVQENRTIRKFLRARPRTCSRAISQESSSIASLNQLPVQVCWPDDGGRFITYGQVVTYDPRNRRRNIGIYRLHVFDGLTTGMHWQIQKGGGFHYFQAEQLNAPFGLAVALGTSPALLLATVAALPEGIDEAMFAGFLQNRSVEFTKGRSISVDVPADAEIILEGIVPLRERRMEGPFGDHFGHYSAAAEFPVFHISTITHRRNPIYPAIVVGKPPMEDKFLGDATQEMLGPLAQLLHREVRDLWAYYEAGFHNLLVVAIEQRYQKEAVKASLGIMGMDQLALTKCIVTVSAGVDVRNFELVMREVHENFDPQFDFIMIPKVPLDTLDFTSFKMNLGSKMIIDATKKQRPLLSRPFIPNAVAIARESDRRIIDGVLVAESMLVIKVSSNGREVVESLLRNSHLVSIPLIAAVSDDVDIHCKESYIWGIFTRFDCERDVLFAESKLVGISPVYRGTMGIDATWKPGYPLPLKMPDEIVRNVDKKWGKIWRM